MLDPGTLDVPAPTAVIATVKITRIHRGHYGIHTVSQIPAITGGAGSVIKVTGLYYTKGNILFADGNTLKGTHILPCTPMG